MIFDKFEGKTTSKENIEKFANLIVDTLRQMYIDKGGTIEDSKRVCVTIECYTGTVYIYPVNQISKELLLELSEKEKLEVKKDIWEV